MGLGKSIINLICDQEKWNMRPNDGHRSNVEKVTLQHGYFVLISRLLTEYSK